ncbi:epoxide hydrolase family protein [Kineococcus sp. SYSU DK004]|uniref:epoxide hydrolase family protein n=1 Tax=Kineococcus sp. SYSU DK004 TaxID=3383125 RepID=UPI003D7C7728
MTLAPTAPDLVQPFTVHVPQADLDDLTDRLARTRWPEAETAPGQGPALHRLRELVVHWTERYDWRRCEAELNSLGSSRTVVDGLGIHLLHVRSPEPAARPLLLCHGWPGSVLEFRKLIGPLTDPVAHGGRAEDAFHVVVPSMPGFGFSDKPTGPGWGVARTADAWIELMRRLGHSDWFAQGGDWGAAVVDAIGRRPGSGCAGLHVNLPLVFPTPEEVRDADPVERRMVERAQRYAADQDAYAREQATRPQTIGYSLLDSPVGLAAWILTVFDDVVDHDGDPLDVVGRDEFLDDVMMHWLPGTGASSARLYWEAQREQAAGAQGPGPTPIGFSVFPGEAVQASRRWVERRYRTVLHHALLERGGHFAAMEQPDLLVEEVRTTFRALRTA